MIKTPRLIIDPEKVRGNITKMLLLCQKWGMDFRPHFKTHQSAAIAQWFKDKGVEKCTVSSVSMAKYFAQHSWGDISIAIPVNILEIAEIDALAQEINLTLIVDHEDSCRALYSQLNHAVDIFIEIDTAYGRSGVHYSQIEVIRSLWKMIDKSSVLRFKGFLSHTGDSYMVQDKEKGAEVFELSRQRMLHLKELFSDSSDVTISMGDTPSSTFSNDFSSIDEWRPGNFVFYDMMQWAAGVCKLEEVALVVRCPVIGMYQERGEIVIYGGCIHLSKESMIVDGKKIYGWLVNKAAAGQMEESAGFPVIGLSQEHGVVAVSQSFLSRSKIGDVLDVIPVHSCMAADLYPAYFDEDGKVFEKYRSNSL